MDAQDKQNGKDMRIIIEADGPYQVEGGIPLVRKTQIVSEYGEPIGWQKGELIPTDPTYTLCRCGRSKNKPFCDFSHLDTDFDGSETAGTRPSAQRRTAYPGSTGIVIRKDPGLCTGAGFCGTRLAGMAKLATMTNDPQMRSLVMAMIERCPSGSLTYALGPDEPDVEPDLPAQIAVTVEITSEGPIFGPLWVTGNIPVVRADGLPFETRNRVTLCCCGKSNNKPLCDGEHRNK
jgi:CDGSH-type Zn-finger protein